MLIEGLRRDAGDLLEVLPQEVGMHVTVRLAPTLARDMNDVALAARAAEQGLVLLPLSRQYAGGKPEQGFLLGYAGWPEADMGAATERLIRVLRARAPH
jgi:GntR family transcriptional regulator/MocR family aminotransferase